MAWKLSNLIWSCVIIVGMVGNFSAALKCANVEALNSCRCDVTEEKFLNMSGWNGNLTQGALTYHFYGCKNVNDGCNDSVLCLEDRGSDPKFTNLGNLKTMSIEPAQVGTVYDIVYSYNGYKSRIGLVCTENFNATLLVGKDISNNKNPVLYLFSKSACLHSVPAHKGMSTGGTLVILFLVCFTVYFVGGAMALYCIRGARGKEMIPNIDFWQSLPGLVKDGTIYILNGCRPTAIPTAESYDRI